MNKLKGILLMALIFGCAPEKIEYPPNCNCGVVLDKGTAQLTSKVCNWLEVENQCTGVIKKICIDNYTTWELSIQGGVYCKPK